MRWNNAPLHRGNLAAASCLHQSESAHSILPDNPKAGICRRFGGMARSTGRLRLPRQPGHRTQK